MTTSTPQFRIKTETAAKAGLKSSGSITYEILKDDAGSEAFIRIVANDSAGYFNREPVAFSKIEACLATLGPEATFPARVFRAAFQGKSVNNGGFLSAVLRHEGLIAAAPDASHQYVRTGDWQAWRDAVIAATGEPLADASAPTPAPAAQQAPKPTKKGKREKPATTPPDPIEASTAPAEGDGDDPAP